MGRASKLSSSFYFDPNLHCFVNEVDAILHQLIRVASDEKAFIEALPQDTNYPVRNEVLLIQPSAWGVLMPLLAQVPFITLAQDRHVYQTLRIVEGAPPLQFTLEDIENNYQLTIKGFERMLLLNAYNSVLCDGKVFQLEGQDCERLFELKQMLVSPSTNLVPIRWEN